MSMVERMIVWTAILDCFIFASQIKRFYCEQLINNGELLAK